MTNSFNYTFMGEAEGSINNEEMYEITVTVKHISGDVCYDVFNSCNQYVGSFFYDNISEISLGDPQWYVIDQYYAHSERVYYDTMSDCIKHKMGYM